MNDRIDALLYLASGTDALLSAPLSLRRKVDAVRRVQGNILAKMKKDVESKYSFIRKLEKAEDLAHVQPIIDNIEKEADEMEDEIETYKDDSDHIGEWLRRTDPEAHAAAEKTRGVTRKFFCNCMHGEHTKKHEQEHRDWVSALETEFYVREEARGVETRNGKKRQFEHAMRYMEEQETTK